MSNEDLARSIRAELISCGFPYDSVEVDDDEIRVIQVGAHRSLPSLATILNAAGLWTFDDNTDTEDARSVINDAPGQEKTINYLKRVAS